MGSHRFELSDENRVFAGLHSFFKRYEWKDLLYVDFSFSDNKKNTAIRLLSVFPQDVGTFSPFEEAVHSFGALFGYKKKESFYEQSWTPDVDPELSCEKMYTPQTWGEIIGGSSGLIENPHKERQDIDVTREIDGKRSGLHLVFTPRGVITTHFTAPGYPLEQKGQLQGLAYLIGKNLAPYVHRTE